jgi:hypothetical protein
MKLNLKSAGLVSCLLYAASMPSAKATVVTMDTTPAWDGSTYEEPFGFGPPGVSVTAFGQFVTAPITGVFQSMTFYLNYVGGSNLPGTTAGPLTYTEYVYAWDPVAEHAVGSALYTSSLQTLANTGGAFVPITFNPNVAVTAGNDYVAFLFANSGNYAEWGMLFSGDGGYPAGLVWDPVGTNFSLLTSSNWVFVNWQSAFTAEFSSTTPLPAALPLFATGLAGLGLLGWRRKRKAQAVA